VLTWAVSKSAAIRRHPPQIASAEQSAAAARQLAAEVRGLQGRLAGVLRQQLGAAQALEAKLEAADAECGDLRGQLAAAEKQVRWFGFERLAGRLSAAFYCRARTTLHA
jgi:hypothetical protein